MPLPPPPLPLEKEMNQSTQLDSPTPSQQELVPSKPQSLTQELDWPVQRLALLKRTLAKDLSNLEFELFIEVCKRRKLDPFAKQIHAVKRGGKLVVQTGIDGFRLIADRSGKYVGQFGPFWCGSDGEWKDVWLKKEPPAAAKVGVLRAGFIEPVWGIANWEMYVAEGPFWKKGGPSQLAKCAEALALRKAFPEELSGLYADEEMYQADTPNPAADNTLIPDEDQPVMVFPSSIVHSWTDTTGTMFCLMKDTDSREWVVSGKENFDLLDAAISGNSFLLINYMVDTGRRIVLDIVPPSVDGAF